MEALFNLCKKQIEKGKTDGLQEKMDAYLLNDRLTVDEYNALKELMAQINK